MPAMWISIEVCVALTLLKTLLIVKQNPIKLIKSIEKISGPSNFRDMTSTCFFAVENRQS